MMDLSQPLYVDCSVEYDLDMTRFPGWDDPRARAQPALLLHLPDHEFSLCCNGCLPSENEFRTTQREVSTTEDELRTTLREFSTTVIEPRTTLREFSTTEDELWTTQREFSTTENELRTTLREFSTTEDELRTTQREFSTTENELRTTLREFSTTEDELREIIQDFCSDKESSEDELSSFVDDVLGFTDGLMMMSDAISPSDSDSVQSLDTAPFSTDAIFIRETLADFLCGSYIIDQMSPSLDSSPSSAHSPIVDFDFLLCSPHQGSERPYRKRKNSGEPDHRPSAKRPCCYGDDLLSEVYSTFTTTSDLNSFENEMRYGLSVCVRE